MWSEEQLRSWAHLIQMKKHTSYEVPPNKGFWKVGRQLKKSKDTISTAGQNEAEFDCGDNIGHSSSTDSSDATICISPSMRVNLRGQCVQQLLQLHELLQKGGINQ